MRLKISKRSVEALKEVKENASELLEMELNEMELTDANIKKAKEIANRLHMLTRTVFEVGGLSIYIETDDGDRINISLF